MNKKWKLLSLGLIIGLMLLGCDLIAAETIPTPMPTPVIDPGVIAGANLVPADHVTLRFAMPGQVAATLVAEGDHVEKGQTLARLKNTESLEAQLKSTELGVMEAEQNLQALEDNARIVAENVRVDLATARQGLVDAERAWDAIDTEDFIETLDDARLDLIEAQKDLEDAQENLADHQELDEDNPVRQQYEDELDEAQAAYDDARWAFETLENQKALAEAQLGAAQAAVADAERRVEATQDGQPDPEDLALADANLAHAKAQLQAAKRALYDSTLTAPFAGKVVRVDLTEGTYTSPSEAAMVLADLSAWYLETKDLTENQVVGVEEGQEVTITFDALPGKTFTGEVESISEYFLERFGDITYVVRIRLLETDARLRWGMTAEVLFPD